MKTLRLSTALGLGVLLSFGLIAQDSPKTAPTSEPAASPSSPSTKTLNLEVAVVRFKPARAERILQGFRDLQGALPVIIERLKGEGDVSVLYMGTREVRLEDKSRAKFDALETRPVVLVGKPGAPIPPATAYGLALDVSMRGVEGERFGLAWEGTITWSPEIVDGWKGERFLSFMGGAANIAKKAGSLTEDKTVGAAADIGLGFAQLFSPKGGAGIDSQIYELPVNKTVSLTSSRNCKSGDLIINTTTAEMGSKEAQTILLLMWPTVL